MLEFHEISFNFVILNLRVCFEMKPAVRRTSSVQHGGIIQRLFALLVPPYSTHTVLVLLNGNILIGDDYLPIYP